MSKDKEQKKQKNRETAGDVTEAVADGLTIGVVAEAALGVAGAVAEGTGEILGGIAEGIGGALGG